MFLFQFLHSIILIFCAADLCRLCLPIIIGAVLVSDSPHVFTKRLFADSLMDRMGPPCKGNVAATCIKKKKKLLALAVQERITIIDSEDSAPWRKGKEKVLPPMSSGDTLSLSDSNKVQEVPPAAVKKSYLLDQKGLARAEV